MSQAFQQSQWSDHNIDTMAAVPNHDFDNLLDFGDIQLDFPIYEASSKDSGHHLSSLNETLDHQRFSPPQSRSGFSQQTTDQMHPTNDDFFNFTFQSAYPQHLDFSMPEQKVRQRAAVPPTPNSVEMRGDPQRYLQQIDGQARPVNEQKYQLRKDDMLTFTPLISPAVTPHETSYQMQSEFSVPAAYFSPLTSPALEAQNRDGMRPTHCSQPHTANTSMATSPVNLDMDIIGEEEAQPKPAARSKYRKNSISNRASAQTTRTRQSPIVKPQTQKQRMRLFPVISSKELHELLEESQKSSCHSRHDSSREGSENTSISPEPLSESLMGPPPKPGSVTVSPSIRARASQNQPKVALNREGQAFCPATPASLMRIQPSPQTHPVSGSPHGTPTFVSHRGSQPLNDDFALPEPVAPTESAIQPLRPSGTRSDAVIHGEESMPGTEFGWKAPNPSPLSTTYGPLSSTLSSPSLISTASPSPAIGNKKCDFKLVPSRPNKKRGIISSARVSPALRPKISPNIKPLLPEGHMSEETHTLLLASKSNYQNILEGTHVPGVSYPEDLSTNLTSKRTSHKLAEQGRRNRINLALQELQSLIPSPGIQPKDAVKSSAASTASPEAETPQKREERQSNSKASTVENAIDYIRLLKMRDYERHQKMLEQQREIESLRRKLTTGSSDLKPANGGRASNVDPEQLANGSQISKPINADKTETLGESSEGSFAK